MPALKTHGLFISPSWAHDGDYNRLVEMLNSAKYFKWRNYSVTEKKPKEAGDANELREALKNQMRLTNCVLVISGMYVPRSEWIPQEIQVAEEWGKPIIGIKPRGSEMEPKAVSSVADMMVRWYTPSIICEIRKRAK